MRILVTGGAGFLGVHLCERLLSLGHSVIALDNFSTSDEREVSRLALEDRFSLVEADVCSFPKLSGPFDAIAHLACPASPDQYLRLGIETLAVGSHGSEFVLELAKAHGARVLLASTSEVYGDPKESPQNEAYWGNVNPIGPRSVYDESKRYAEAVFMAHRRTFGTNTGIVRIFNTYGPGLRPNDGRVVSNFVAQALAGENLTVYGDGLQTRSLCYVDDLVAGLVAMLLSDHPGPVNLGNPSELTVLDLAALVLRLTGSSSRIEYRPAPEADPLKRRPDITRAAQLLGWAPIVSLEDGLLETIAWQRNLRAAITATEER
jgi:dTDP-glucose 4,6-dehydratase